MHKEVFDALEGLVKKTCPTSVCNDGTLRHKSLGDEALFNAINMLVKYQRMTLCYQSGLNIEAKFKG